VNLRFLATSDVDGWKIKTYGIAPADTVPRSALVRAARVRAAAALPARPDQEGAFGVGFLIVRDGFDGCLALVDWWARGDELFQRVFVAPTDQPQALEPQTSAGIGSVFELEVLVHERAAWLRHVLANPAGRDINAYLGDTL
jgi:hypothetical protein